MAQKFKLRPVYIIRWGDAFIDDNDFKISEATQTEPVYRYTVGFLICKNQHGYILATDMYEKEDDEAAAKMFIPIGMVKKVTVIKK